MYHVIALLRFLIIQKLKPTSAVWPQLGHETSIAKIRTLDLSGNPLKSIPVEVYGMVNLKSLFISGCSCQYVNSMDTLEHVTKLKLDHNDLESEKVGALPPALVSLNLSYNHFNCLPTALHGLMYLVTLELNNNRIISLDGIELLVSLEEINLDDNLLADLPESICALTKLKKISLARNRFTKLSVHRPGEQSIPAGLLQNSALDHIELAGNTGITKKDIMSFEGIDKFLERRQALKEKNFSGGAMSEVGLLGLD